MGARGQHRTAAPANPLAATPHPARHAASHRGAGRTARLSARPAAAPAGAAMTKSGDRQLPIPAFDRSDPYSALQNRPQDSLLVESALRIQLRRRTVFHEPVVGNTERTYLRTVTAPVEKVAHGAPHAAPHHAVFDGHDPLEATPHLVEQLLVEQGEDGAVGAVVVGALADEGGDARAVEVGADVLGHAAEGDGVVDYVDATTIRILYDRTEDEEFVSFEPALKEYRIPKFRKTNQNMTIDLRPICDKGQRVKKGDILTEGYSTEKGELALGKNLLVAYMPWKGYNYEDAIVLNERVVREDLLTSVHVEEYSLEVRETKRGMEELTSDIPNVSEEATKDLDENGIVRIGARIEPGDIMIGKITPKGESDPSPEEKLLRAIFGDKAGDVKDASLKASPSLKGVVIDKRLFSRVIKSRSSKLADKALLPKIDDEFDAKVADLRGVLIRKLLKLTENYVSEGVKDYMGADIISKGAKFSPSDFGSVPACGIRMTFLFHLILQENLELHHIFLQEHSYIILPTDKYHRIFQVH